MAVPIASGAFVLLDAFNPGTFSNLWICWKALRGVSLAASLAFVQICAGTFCLPFLQVAHFMTPVLFRGNAIIITLRCGS